jgi:hypothetical protein
MAAHQPETPDMGFYGNFRARKVDRKTGYVRIKLYAIEALLPAAKLPGTLPNHRSRCPVPRMGRDKGEVGSSPTLSRNCNWQATARSQVDPLDQFNTTSQKGGVNA